MRLGDKLFFAPDIPFSKVSWTNGDFPRQLNSRFEGFYLRPAQDLAESNHAFASGLLLVCAIDALARLSTGASGVTVRITGFCRRFPGFNDEIAKIFCDHFRNGLVHQARVKDGSEFDLKLGTLVKEQDGRLTINPQHLCSAVRHQLTAYIGTLNADPILRVSVSRKLKRIFSEELRR